MKSKDLQGAVKNKYENGDGPAKIYRDLGRVVSKRIINLWIKMIKKHRLYQPITLSWASSYRG